MTGLSGAAVSNYTRWLLQSEVLTAETVRQSHAIRPIQLLQLNKNRGTSLAMVFRQQQFEAELVALDASPICRWVEKITTPDQPGFMNALGHVVDQGLERAAKMSRQIDTMGLCLRGQVGLNTIGVNVIPEYERWRACDMIMTLPALRRLGKGQTWPNTLCRAYALAATHRTKKLLAYLEVWKGGFTLASVEHCRPLLGRSGNSTDLFHRSVGPGCPLCFCGAEGCMVSHLENGTTNPAVLEQIADHLQRIIPTDTLAVQWAIDPSLLDPFLQKAGFSKILRPDNPDELAWQGLRMLVSEAAATTILRTRAKIISKNKETQWTARLRNRLLQSGSLVSG